MGPMVRILPMTLKSDKYFIRTRPIIIYNVRACVHMRTSNYFIYYSYFMFSHGSVGSGAGAGGVGGGGGDGGG